MSEGFPAENTTLRITLTNHSVVVNNTTRKFENASEFSPGRPHILQPCLHTKFTAFEDNIPVSVICAVFIVFGVVYTLFGKFLLKFKILDYDLEVF